MSAPFSTEPVPGPAAEARLATLAKLTRHYAQAGKSLFGLSKVPGGIVAVAAGLALWLGAPRLGLALGCAVPVLLAAVSALLRPGYQRLGHVDESGASAGISHPTSEEVVAATSSIQMALWTFLAFIVAAGGIVTSRHEARDLDALIPLASAVLSSFLLSWRPPRRSDGTWHTIPSIGVLVTGLALLARAARGRGEELQAGREVLFCATALLLLGAVLAVFGLVEHRRHRTLMACLAAPTSVPAEPPLAP